MGNVATALAATYRDEVMVSRVGKLHGDILRCHRGEKCRILTSNNITREKYQTQMKGNAQVFESDLKDMKGMVITENGRAAVVAMEEAWGAFRRISAQVTELALASKGTEAQKLSSLGDISAIR